MQDRSIDLGNDPVPATRVVAAMTEPAALSAPQSARFRAAAGRYSIDTGVQVTPLGLFAIGALVSAILLSVPPIVRASRRPRSERGTGPPPPTR